MKLPLDECQDWRLRRDLPGHEVKTVPDMNWQSIKNDRLLTHNRNQSVRIPALAPIFL